jgi:hypothetical protein
MHRLVSELPVGVALPGVVLCLSFRVAGKREPLRQALKRNPQALLPASRRSEAAGGAPDG